MRRKDRTRALSAADEEAIAQAKAHPTDIDTAGKLRRMVETVSAQEFSWQEAH
jgi:hypothetical protein